MDVAGVGEVAELVDQNTEVGRIAIPRRMVNMVAVIVDRGSRPEAASAIPLDLPITGGPFILSVLAVLSTGRRVQVVCVFPFPFVPQAVHAFVRDARLVDMEGLIHVVIEIVDLYVMRFWPGPFPVVIVRLTTVAVGDAHDIPIASALFAQHFFPFTLPGKFVAHLLFCWRFCYLNRDLTREGEENKEN